MGILDNFEKGLERAVNGAFAKTFRSGLQPVEISSALKRELDTKAAVVSRDRILVPNSFRVLVGTSDFARMKSLGPTLVDELTQVVQKHAAAQSFQFAGSVSVTLVEQPRLSAGLLEIESSTIQRDVTWSPVLDVAGKRYPITRARTVIGRGREADITVEDTGISRKHIEILWDGKRAEVHDLDSTNGSQLNGQAITRSVVEPDSVIQIGRTRVVFRVLAQAADAPAFAEAKPAPDAAAAPARRESAAPAAAPEAAPRPSEQPAAPLPAAQSAAPPPAAETAAAAPRKSFPSADPPRRAKRAPLKPKPAADEAAIRAEKPAFPLDEPAPDDRQPPEPGAFRWNL
ncbi:hypothetical protein B7R25_00770 [Subtercola boreus]|uniref:FHA domain-containing protein n=1 Tax=Subtercola boreus TaxID=120213 RepID=A0A3E0WGS8_9MICO|nr:hypothetical protein B7R24_00775 [Subtercola boreus]RFA23855.1 hypothetical protein B7R23_00775 [Subtercola boreus]RFA29556.1 hypothetical protein B7R25_00770 [Subtercola boreus]